MTRWTTDGKMLHGQLRVPLQLGVVGGATAALPLAQIAMRLGKIATVADAQAVLAALGLVQNLAACVHWWARAFSRGTWRCKPEHWRLRRAPRGQRLMH